MDNLKFNRQFFRDFRTLLAPYWRSEEKWRAYGLFALIIACITIQVFASVALNFFYQNFFDALQNFNKGIMLHLLWQFILLVIILIIVVGYSVYLSGILSIRWRRWLTQHYLTHWLSHHTFYRMQVLHKNVDNPDQRISEDLDAFTSSTLSLFTSLLSSILTLVIFGYILWKISGSIHIPLGKQALTVPGYLLWIALICAVIGTWLTRMIGRPLPGLNYQQQQFNANFRFGMARLRETSEQVALYRGETLEKKQLGNTFADVVNNFIRLIKVQKYLMFFQFGYNSIAYFIGMVAGLPLYFEKKIQIGGLIQISQAYGEVISSLSILVTAFAGIAAWRAVIYRLTEFNHHMEAVNQLSSEATIHFKPQTNHKLTVHQLDLRLPDNTLLLKNLHLSLEPGHSLLITGSSGVGKSTLLRALAGIWPHGQGEIYLPQNAKLMFLPQKPYLPLGTLKNALIYPDDSLTISDEQLQAFLTLCGLPKLMSQLNTSANWAQELSLGEQQLIGFVRVFLQKPEWIFLDEATSALDENNESKMYQLLREQLPAATIISVGHRSSLQAFHDKSIALTAPDLSIVPPEQVDDQTIAL